MVSIEKKGLVKKLATRLNEISINKIKDFFESMGCAPLFILKTPEAGKPVDNYHGVEFNLSEYAVIHKGDPYKKGNCLQFYEFERKEGIEIMIFNGEGQNIPGLIDELKKRDAYEVVYRAN